MRLLVMAMAIFSFSAFADHHKGHEHGPGHGHGHGKNPACEPIKKACTDAGYTMGGHKAGKGLIVDCMGKLAKGEKVEGVAIDPADPTHKACIDHLNSKKEHMKEHGKHHKGHKVPAPDANAPAVAPAAPGH